MFVGFVIGMIVMDIIWRLINHFATRPLINELQEYVNELRAHIGQAPIDWKLK